jgi:hypothetical protein
MGSVQDEADPSKRRWLVALAHGSTLLCGYISQSLRGDPTGLYFLPIWLWMLVILEDYDALSIEVDRARALLRQDTGGSSSGSVRRNVLPDHIFNRQKGGNVQVRR